MQAKYLTSASYPEYIKNFKDSTIKKANNTVKTWAKDLNRHLTKKDTEKANSLWLIISHREMQIKTLMR